MSYSVRSKTILIAPEMDRVVVGTRGTAPGHGALRFWGGKDPDFQRLPVSSRCSCLWIVSGRQCWSSNAGTKEEHEDIGQNSLSSQSNMDIKRRWQQAHPARPHPAATKDTSHGTKDPQNVVKQPPMTLFWRDASFGRPGACWCVRL